MNDAIRATLRELIAQQGSALYRDPRRLESMLRDVAGDQQTEIFVLTTAARAGVLDELLAASPGLESVVADRAVARLSSEFGLDQEVSRWAVASWADALGLPPVSRVGSLPPAPAVPVGDDATRTVLGAGAAGAGAVAGVAAGAGIAPGAPPAAPYAPVAPSYPPPPGATGPPPPPYAPQPGVASGPGMPRSSSDRRRRRLLIPLLALAVFALGLAAIVVGLNSSSSTSDEVFAEPALSYGIDAFTPAVHAALTQAATHLTVPPGITTPAGGSSVVRAVSGAAPGLYGGTGDQATCDARAMLDFLDAHADMARAWAGVEGISVSQLRSYVAELTPMLLRADTRVTNHGFRNGAATTLQSILQAGTAVLVDRFGVPRTRCACGNPLTPPVAAQHPRYRGDQWPGFDPGNTVVVSASPTIITSFTVVNVYTGDAYEKPTGIPGLAENLPETTTTLPSTVPPTALTVPPDVHLGSGDVQVTLLWQSGDDLDVHVVDPGGEEISFNQPVSNSGGSLDHDDIASCAESPGSATHVENVFWAAGTAPSGQYQAFVRNFRSCGGAASYELRIAVDGEVVSDTQGSVSADTDPVTFSR